MKKFTPFFLTIFLLLLLPGCIGGLSSTRLYPGSNPLATSLKPLQNQEHAKNFPTITPFIQPSTTPTSTYTPIPLTIDPTYFNFPTETPTPTLDSRQYTLRIISPGPMSKVISPIKLIVNVAPDYTGTTRVELIGENGAELYRKIFKTYSNLGYFTRVDEKIRFEIKGVAELARLQISTLDNKGQLLAINSVRLLLQAVGENQFTPPFNDQERILLRFPKSDSEISGGNLPVTGEFQPANNLPLALELLDVDGEILGTRLLQLEPANGAYQQFTTTIPYQVTNKKTPVRLVIRQSDDRIDGLAYLFSIGLIINP